MKESRKEGGGGGEGFDVGEFEDNDTDGRIDISLMCVHFCTRPDKLENTCSDKGDKKKDLKNGY